MNSFSLQNGPGRRDSFFGSLNGRAGSTHLSPLHEHQRSKSSSSNSVICPLHVLQQPSAAKVAASKDKVRTPLDPPPVIEFRPGDLDPQKTFLSSPFLFGNVEIASATQRTNLPQVQSAIISGNLVSSLHRVRTEDGQDRGVFVFGDLNIKIPGKFYLRFNLFEMHKNDEGVFHVVKLSTVLTDVFTVFPAKDFPGQMESTALSRTLCEAGIKLRIRKETSKRKVQHTNWSADERHAFVQDHAAQPYHSPIGAPILPNQNHYHGEESLAKRMRLSSPAMQRATYNNREPSMTSNSGGAWYHNTMPYSYGSRYSAGTAASSSMAMLPPPIGDRYGSIIGSNSTHAPINPHLPANLSTMAMTQRKPSPQRHHSLPLAGFGPLMRSRSAVVNGFTGSRQLSSDSRISPQDRLPAAANLSTLNQSYDLRDISSGSAVPATLTSSLSTPNSAAYYTGLSSPHDTQSMQSLQVLHSQPQQNDVENGDIYYDENRQSQARKRGCNADSASYSGAPHGGPPY